MDTTEDVKTLVWAGRIHRLGRNQSQSQTAGISEEQRAWLEPAAKDSETPSASRVFAYVRLRYTRPALTLKDRATEVTDAEYFWWNPKFGRWMNGSAEGLVLVESILRTKGLLDN